MKLSIILKTVYLSSPVALDKVGNRMMVTYFGSVDYISQGLQKKELSPLQVELQWYTRIHTFKDLMAEKWNFYFQPVKDKTKFLSTKLIKTF